MEVIEYTAELNATGIAKIPPGVAALLPKRVKGPVLVFPDVLTPDADLRDIVSEQVLRDAPFEDAIYEPVAKKPE